VTKSIVVMYTTKITILLLLVVTSGCLSDIHLGEGYTDATVQKKYIDVSKQGSHYVVVTDKGPFEVNRPLLDMLDPSRNPDVVYAKINENKTYRLHHFGFRFDITYDYPIIVGVTEINTTAK